MGINSSMHYGLGLGIIDKSNNDHEWWQIWKRSYYMVIRCYK